MSGVVTSTQSSALDRAGLSTTVVIIVASTIGAVLVIAIILAVIFLKRPRIERVEHVYAVPTPIDASSGATSGATLKNERPIMKDYYCAVADAIPSPRLHISPASPGYAEVEDVCKGDNCRWDPHTFTFGPTLYRQKPNNFPFSETGPNISSFALPHGRSDLAPTHTRTFSDSTHDVVHGSPNINKPVRATRSFRDPKTTDYENIVIDEKNQSPCFVQGDHNYLLHSRLGRVTGAASAPSQGNQCVQIKSPQLPSTEALYATSSVMNHSGVKRDGLLEQRNFLKPSGATSSGPEVTVLRPDSKSTSTKDCPNLYNKINSYGQAPKIAVVDRPVDKKKDLESQGHRMQLSKGDNSLAGESPVYENTIVR